MVKRLLASLLLALATLTFAGAAPASATPTLAQSAIPNVVHVQDSAPHKVHGFTNHAKLRMSERDISAGEVKDLVAGYADNAVKQKNGNWYYSDGIIAAVVNSNGWVVTVMN